MHSIFYYIYIKKKQYDMNYTDKMLRDALKGKVIVVTGGGSGLGNDDQVLHGIGRKVAITSRDLDKLKIQLQNLSLKQVVLVCHYNVTFVTMMKSKICYKPF
jgi:NADP-dependent 3-hydroxy acid dehydrogenase YdfG